jgi:hypothetical protein
MKANGPSPACAAGAATDIASAAASSDLINLDPGMLKMTIPLHRCTALVGPYRQIVFKNDSHMRQ